MCVLVRKCLYHPQEPLDRKSIIEHVAIESDSGMPPDYAIQRDKWLQPCINIHAYSWSCYHGALFNAQLNPQTMCENTVLPVDKGWFSGTMFVRVCMCVCMHIGRCLVERPLLNFGAVLVFCCLSVSRPHSLHPLYTPSHSLSIHPSSHPLRPHLPSSNLSYRLFHLPSVGCVVCISVCVCLSSSVCV